MTTRTAVETRETSSIAVDTPSPARSAAYSGNSVETHNTTNVQALQAASPPSFEASVGDEITTISTVSEPALPDPKGAPRAGHEHGLNLEEQQQGAELIQKAEEGESPLGTPPSSVPPPDGRIGSGKFYDPEYVLFPSSTNLFESSLP